MSSLFSPRKTEIEIKKQRKYFYKYFNEEEKGGFF
jgi:hypothetical protein